MSIISTTISNNIYYGSGQTYPSPLTITNTGAVISAATDVVALKGTGGGTLFNGGTIVARGASSIGVELSSSGSINNTGLIQGTIRGVYIQGAGYVVNTTTGTVLATAPGAQS